MAIIPDTGVHNLCSHARAHIHDEMKAGTEHAGTQLVETRHAPSHGPLQVRQRVQRSLLNRDQLSLQWQTVHGVSHTPPCHLHDPCSGICNRIKSQSQACICVHSYMGAREGHCFCARTRIWKRFKHERLLHKTGSTYTNTKNCTASISRKVMYVLAAKNLLAAF